MHYLYRAYNNNDSAHRNSSTTTNNNNAILSAPMKLCKNSYAQTEYINNEHIFNAVSNVNLLPTVECYINSKFSCLSLIDTGSSLSLLNKSLFLELKPQLTYKNISSKVQISTMNSKITYHGCINISFKISKFSFKHIFYLVNMPQNSKFNMLLGFDFLQKNNILIDSGNNVLLYHNSSISMLPINKKNDTSHIINNSNENQPTIYNGVDQSITDNSSLNNSSYVNNNSPGISTDDPEIVVANQDVQHNYTVSHNISSNPVNVHPTSSRYKMCVPSSVCDQLSTVSDDNEFSFNASNTNNQVLSSDISSNSTKIPTASSHNCTVASVNDPPSSVPLSNHIDKYYLVKSLQKVIIPPQTSHYIQVYTH